MCAVLGRAVDLAEAQRARLTLAKTTDPGSVVKWFGPPALLAAGAGVTDSELQAVATDKLCASLEARAEVGFADDGSARSRHRVRASPPGQSDRLDSSGEAPLLGAAQTSSTEGARA